MGRTLEVLIPGLAVGGIYVLLALGFNVTFATSRILNLAHGEFLMFGTAVGFFFIAFLGWSAIPALIATVVAAAVIGALEERLAVRPALKRGFAATGWLISTLGFAILVRSAFSLVMGSNPRVFPTLFSLKPVSVAGVLIVPHHIALVVIALVVAGLLGAFFQRTMVGRALGAVSQDLDAAALRGIPVALMSVGSFALASGLAALAGFLAAPITGAYPTIGLLFTLKGFIAAAVGGIPKVRGAVVGGFLLGAIEALGVDRIGPGYRNAVVFGVLLVILAVRPGGLFASGNVRAV